MAPRRLPRLAGSEDARAPVAGCARPRQPPAASVGQWQISDSSQYGKRYTGRAAVYSALWGNARFRDVVRVLAGASDGLRVPAPVLAPACGRHHARGVQNAAPGAFQSARGGAVPGAV